MRFFCLMTLFLINLTHDGMAQDLAGHWKGSVILKGTAWPIEVDFERNEAKTAQLSIPTMGMIDHSIALDRSSKKRSVELPFGIGEFELNPNDGLIVSHRKLSNVGRITLLLEQIENYQRPYVQKDVTIPNGNTSLNGTMYVPKNRQAPVPGVIILHGSGTSGRNSWEYRSWADFFARRGIASLVYDKRSFEETYPDLETLADDAKSVLTYFQKQPEIKDQEVGFFGGSQAAWLATSVASQDTSNVAFIIMSGWPAVTPAEQEMQSIESQLQAADLTGDEYGDAASYLRLYFYVASTLNMWDELKGAAESATQEKWGKLVPIPQTLSDVDWWNRNHSFPTQKHLQKVSCPILACYGENDTVVPPSRNSYRLREILTRAGNKDVTVEIFKNADHRIEVPMVIKKDQVQWPHLSKDYLKKIETWLKARQFIN